LGTWGTSRELARNILGIRQKSHTHTHTKVPLSHPQKGKNWAHHEGMLNLPIICGHFEQ